MVFYNTDKQKYFATELRFSDSMAANELLIFHLMDVLRELSEQKELVQKELETTQGKRKICHTTNHGEEQIEKQLREIAKETVYLIYKDGKLIQP